MFHLPVSVVIPTYNRAHLVIRAVENAIQSIQEGDEIIVVDDGSTDNTAEVLASYQDRITFKQTPNGGAGRARNIGVQLARHPLIAFLDSDDEWMPAKMYLQRSLMEARPDLVFCFSDFSVRDRHGTIKPRYLYNWHKDPRSWNEILGRGEPFSSFAPLPQGHLEFLVHSGDLYLAQMTACYVLTSSLMVNRVLAADGLWFAEDLSYHEDWECFGRLARRGFAAYLDCETTWQIGHSGPRVSGANIVESTAARVTLLNRIWGADANFLANHNELFQKEIQAAYYRKANALIHVGRLREAREVLSYLSQVSLTYRVLSRLPGFVLKAITGIFPQYILSSLVINLFAKVLMELQELQDCL